MKLILAFVAIFSAYEAFACELTLPKKLLIVDSANGSWPFEHKDCTPAQFDEAHSVLANQDGQIPVARIKAALQPTISVKAEGNHIEVTNMAYLIRQSFTEVGDAGMVIGNPFQGNLIGLPENGDHVLHCHPCQFNGEEVMRLHVKNFQGHETDYSFQVKFSRFVLAYKVRQTIPAFTTKLSAEMFEQVRTPAASYGQYLSDLATLSFYKTNKTLRAGEIVRTSDLVPQTLVRAGDRVELIFENSQVRVKSQALSRQNGGVGDTVEVWNQLNGKKYVGTVKDHKRVVVEL